jgi:hypothetical protein
MALIDDINRDYPFQVSVQTRAAVKLESHIEKAQADSRPADFPQELVRSDGFGHATTLEQFKNVVKELFASCPPAQ